MHEVNAMMDEKTSVVKIFISYHKDGEFLESDVLTPIHVGAALSEKDLTILRDDNGDNISAKNDRYCELTAQYWAWKNAVADYYGFMHYRRHFVFREIANPVELGGVVMFSQGDEAYKQNIGLCDNEIYACIKDYDVILPTPVDSSVWGTLSNEIQFSCLDNLHAIDFELTCQTVLELYPEYEEAVFEFRRGKDAYWYNMFIMRKEIFFDYCEWLFSILEKTESKIDFTYYSEQEMRSLAFMAERLLSIYMLKLLKDKPGLKVKHLKMTFLKNTEKLPNIYPAFADNNIAIAVSCNEYYMPILGVMLGSLLENGTRENNYDILVLRNKPEFDSNITVRYIRMLEDQVRQYPNAGIRFVDISRMIGEQQFFVRGNFTTETYFRLFLPKLLKNYDKVLYLDADMVVCHDVAELYNTELDGMLMGAVRDPIISGSNKSSICNKHDYMEKLGIKNIYDYFQAGVLLINLINISKDGLCEKMIEYAATHECDLVDQDILNLFCQGQVKFIDNKWNVDVNSIAMEVVPFAPAAMWKEYQKNRESAYIYHFAGADKPWNNPGLDKADIFWAAARKTPWYEIILEDLVGSAVFFRRGITRQDPILGKLFLLPNNITNCVLPIMKAYAELSAIGLADTLLEIIRSSGKQYELKIKGKQVIFYGAGKCCKQILLYLDEIGLPYPDSIWDRAGGNGQRLCGISVVTPDFSSLRGREDVLCVITIESKSVSKMVKQTFIENGFSNIIENQDIMHMLAQELWLKLEERQLNASQEEMHYERCSD